MDVAAIKTIVGMLFLTHPIREDRPIEEVKEFPLFNEEDKEVPCSPFKTREHRDQSVFPRRS